MIPIHPDYKYSSIPIVSTNADEVEFNVNYIGNLISSFNRDINKRNMMDYISRFGGGYIRIYRNSNDNFKLDYSIGIFSELEKWSIQNDFTYERPFYMDDIKKGVIENILEKGTSIIEPTYKPKGKPIRESLITERNITDKYPYKKIIFIIKTLQEGYNFLEYLKTVKNNIKIDSGLDDLIRQNSYLIRHDPIYICFQKYNNDRLTWEWDDLVDMNMYQPPEEYERLFNDDDIKNDFMNNIFINGTSIFKPTYKPKGKPIRESLITESLETENQEEVEQYLEANPRTNKPTCKVGDIVKLKDDFENIIKDTSYKLHYFEERIEHTKKFLDKDLKVLLKFKYGISHEYPWWSKVTSDGGQSCIFIIDDLLEIVIKKPTYKPKVKPIREKLITEGTIHPNYQWGSIVVAIYNDDDLLTLSKHTVIPRFTIEHISRHLKEIGPVYIRSQLDIHNEFYYTGYDNLSVFRHHSPAHEKLFTIKDVKNGLFERILKDGRYVSEPTYIPKVKPIRESVDYIHPDYYYDSIIIGINNIDEFNSIIDIIEEYISNPRDISNYKYKLSLDSIYLRFVKNFNDKLQIDGCSFLSNLDRIQKNMKFKYEKVFTVKDVKKDILKNILNDGVPIKTPTYKPKIKPIRESNEEYAPFIIYCDNREDCVEMEEFLHSNGFLYADNKKYYIRDDEKITESTFVEIELQKRRFTAWLIKKELLGFKLLNYKDVKNQLRNLLLPKPSYKPKNIIRESIKNEYSVFVYRCDDEEDSKNVQKILLKYGYLWGGRNSYIKELNNLPQLLYVDIDKNSIVHSRPDAYNIKNFIMENDDVCKTIYDESCKDEFLDIARSKSQYRPTYEPKNIKRFLDFNN